MGFHDRYQDEVGASACKACPRHTLRAASASAKTGGVRVEECVCAPGYYATRWNASLVGRGPRGKQHRARRAWSIFKVL